MKARFSVAAAAILVLAAGCEPEPVPVSPGSPEAASTTDSTVACQKAEAALARVQAANSVEDVIAPVEDFLRAARDSGEPVVVYQASQVGDAYRGSAPELTLEPALANMVEMCRSVFAQ